MEITMKENECNRCRYKWFSRIYTGELPKRCPRCKSPYWNKPRIKKTKKKWE